MGPPRRNNNNNAAQNQNQHHYQPQPQNVPPPQTYANYNASQSGSHGHSPKSQRIQQQRHHRQQRSITSPPPFPLTPPLAHYSVNRDAPIYPGQPSSSGPPQDLEHSQRSSYHAESNTARPNHGPTIVTNTTAVMARPGSALTELVTIVPNFLPEPASNAEPPSGGTSGTTMTAASRYNHNLRVLRRRDASIISIFDQFSHVCVYHHNGEKWEKQGYEGSMFLYERNSYPPYGFYILNRMGREDYIQPLYPEDDISASKSYLMIRSFPEFTQRRMAAAQAAGLCGPKHMFSEMHSLDAVRLKINSEEGKGRPQIIGLWTYTNDSREPMMDVMMRLHSFIKASKRYPDEYRYGPDRPPPPNPHARAASASPALSRAPGAQTQTSMDSFASFTGSPVIQGASASGSMDSMSSNTSELDKLFAKLTPSHAPAGSDPNLNQPSTPNMTLDSLFAAAAAATPSGEESFRSSPGPSTLFGPGPIAAAPATNTSTGTMPTTGLPLLDSIFASADVQHSQPSQSSQKLHIHPQHQQHQVVAGSGSQAIPIYSPKPTTTSLPQILNEDVISGLLSRSGSTAPNANASAEATGSGPGPGSGEYGQGPKPSSRMGSRSRAGSVNLLAPSDGADAGRTREKGHSQHQRQGKAFGVYTENRNHIQFDGDMTPRAPPPSDILPVLMGSPAAMEFYTGSTYTRGDHNTSSSSHHGASPARASGSSQPQFQQQQQQSQSQPQSWSQTKYPQQQHQSHQLHNRSEPSSSTTFMPIADSSGNGSQFHSQQHQYQQAVTSAITSSGTPGAGGIMTAGAGDPTVQSSQQQQQQQQPMPGKQARPAHLRNLVPFRDDSELWPYPRAPLDDRGESDEDEAVSVRGGNNQKKEGGGDGQQQKQNNMHGSYREGRGQGRKNGAEFKDDRNEEGDDENDGRGDDEDIIELDFSEIRALSDPSMLDKPKKGKGKERERDKGKGKKKEEGSDDGFEKTEKENDKSTTGGQNYGLLGHHHTGMLVGRGRGRGRGMFAPIGPGHSAQIPTVNNQPKDDNNDKEKGGKNRKKGKKERAAEKDRLEREAIENSWDVPDRMVSTMTQQNNNHNNNHNNNGGYQRVLGTPPPPASPSPPPANEDDSVVVEKLTRAFAKSGVLGGRGARFAVTEPAASAHAHAHAHAERPRSAASIANGSTRGVGTGGNGETPGKLPMNGGGAMYGQSSPQLHHQQQQQQQQISYQQGESALDQGHVRGGLIHVFNGVRASGMSGISPGTRLEKNEFIRKLLMLIQTDRSFVDTLWQDYLTKTGGYALPS